MKYEYSVGAINPTTLAGSSMMGSLFDMETSNVAFDSYLDGKLDLFGRTHDVILGAASTDWLAITNSPSHDWELPRTSLIPFLFPKLMTTSSSPIALMAATHETRSSSRHSTA